RSSIMSPAIHAQGTRHPNSVFGAANMGNITPEAARSFAANDRGSCLTERHQKAPEFSYEEWRDVVGSHCGRYTPQGIQPSACARHICGFKSVDLACNAYRVERTLQDIRLDGRDHYYALVAMAGRTRVVQNDQAYELSVSDVALVDAARPVTYFSQEGDARFL